MVAYTLMKPCLLYCSLVFLFSCWLPQETMLALLFQPQTSLITLGGFLLMHTLIAYSFFQGVILYKQCSSFIHIRLSPLTYFFRYTLYLIFMFVFYFIFHMLFYSQYAHLIFLSLFIDIISIEITILFFHRSNHALLIVNTLIFILHLCYTFG